MKRQPSEWEKIIAKETTDKELISKIYKQLIQLNTRKANNPIKKWERNPVYETAKETLMYRTVLWTLWERERVGRLALKHVKYHV